MKKENTKAAKVSANCKDVVTKTAAPVAIDNEISRNAKTAVKSYFADFDKVLKALWDGLKAEEPALKVLNNAIAGRAGAEGVTPAVWLVKYYTKYVDSDFWPCSRRKDEDGRVYFARAAKNGVTARGLLKRAALNCIESQRVGNRWAQEVVTPIAKVAK